MKIQLPNYLWYELLILWKFLFLVVHFIPVIQGCGIKWCLDRCIFSRNGKHEHSTNTSDYHFRINQGCPPFFSHGQHLLFQNFRGPKFTLWDFSSSKNSFFCRKLSEDQKKRSSLRLGRYFCPKLDEDQKKKKKKGLQPANSDGFCGVLQRTNKIKIKDSHL